LLDDQFVGGDIDAVQRRRGLLKIIAAIIRLGQQDWSVGVARIQGQCPPQPVQRLVELVGEDAMRPS
jgi:hypothetical protein